eukprot:362682-Chlamydomonas_euryale.AAC.4
MARRAQCMCPSPLRSHRALIPTLFTSGHSVDNPLPQPQSIHTPTCRPTARRPTAAATVHTHTTVHVPRSTHHGLYARFHTNAVHTSHTQTCRDGSVAV